MISSSASVKQTDHLRLALEPTNVFENGTDFLGDTITTDLDQDLTPRVDKAEASNNGHSFRFGGDRAEAATWGLSTTASVNAEWKRMGTPRDEEVEGGRAAAVQVQPRRTQELSEADLILQPFQVEELLGQNSVVELCNSKSAERNCKMTPRGDVLHSPPRPIPLLPRRMSWWDGFRTCLHPVVGLLKKDNKPSKKREDCVISFTDIRELDFIGSGSQGAVFVGDYLGAKVAVKKVKDIAYCQEAVHMRKLSHTNIVKFRYVPPLHNMYIFFTLFCESYWIIALL